MKYHIKITRDALGGQYLEPLLWEGIYRVRGKCVIRPVRFSSHRAAEREAARINRGRGPGAAIVVETQ